MSNNHLFVTLQELEFFRSASLKTNKMEPEQSSTHTLYADSALVQLSSYLLQTFINLGAISSFSWGTVGPIFQLKNHVRLGGGTGLLSWWVGRSWSKGSSMAGEKLPAATSQAGDTKQGGGFESLKPKNWFCLAKLEDLFFLFQFEVLKVLREFWPFTFQESRVITKDTPQKMLTIHSEACSKSYGFRPVSRFDQLWRVLDQPDLDPPHFWWEAGEIMVIYFVEWRCQHDHVKYTQNM